ncbi:MAG: Cro/Cl family transcriptional regulator [Anaerolineaceae bacterium]|nr:Cro/Cl family transcriptional regulator [Anaerolineaceae bacterium]
MEEYLRSTDIIDWDNPAVLELAQLLGTGTKMEIAQRCFEWVRDEIRHSYDYKMNPVTCTASEVLAARTGYCYAKSHLLAALLRANGIPTGFCYQRLTGYDDATFCLHGLNSIYLPEFGWYRVDARGNKPNINAQFVPPVEQLAYKPGEYEQDFPEVWADPMPEVVKALRTYKTYDALSENLPDRA